MPAKGNSAMPSRRHNTISHGFPDYLPPLIRNCVTGLPSRPLSTAAIGQKTEAGAAYCVFNFSTRTVVYLRVTGFTLSGTTVAADATEWAYS